ncbi:GNAT family N-acetyltransferase [Catenovulum sp. SM1970]|uniref:GNAT family N-acetyltransferase n=1 Tax=Marinifaba aquimaris TaxID=2741323 RepID=UPI00157230F0|nr:GNAT family N-acetyltransferase [Marinifaba aquimaris]NTS76203.1 GNAT family N-acetyltransferase [Marinifaba aquimaris]
MSVTIYYLQMHSVNEINAKPQPTELSITEAELKNYRLNKFLYQLVGETWQWTDKLSIPNQQWQRYAESDTLRTYVAYVKGSIAGYYELESQTDGQVQIAYFGLAPDFIGKGYGGYLLTHALQTAWSYPNTKRVWVHTCSLDHPSALANYQARGLNLYHSELNEEN